MKLVKKIMKKIITIDNILTTLLIIVILQYFTIIFEIDFLDPIQNTLEDFYISDIVYSKIRNYDEIAIDSNIVLVNIGELDRRGIARQLNIINRYEPKVIGIDAFFRTERGPAVDEPLCRALERTKNLVMVSQLTMLEEDDKKDRFDTLIKSNDIFSRYAESGFANKIINPDDYRISRDCSLIEEVGDTIEPSFAVSIVKFYNHYAYQRVLKRGNDKEKINFKRNIDKYKTFDVNDVFNEGADLESVRGKIVLFGFLGPNLNTLVTEDIFFTPMNKNYVGKSYPDMYGIVLHANIISMILEDSYITTKPEWLSIVFVFLLCYFNMWIYTYIRDNYETFYEPASVAIITLEMILLFIAIILMLHWFNVEIFDPVLRAVFFALLITPMTYEVYHDSLKPLLVAFVKKTFKRRKL